MGNQESTSTTRTTLDYNNSKKWIPIPPGSRQSTADRRADQPEFESQSSGFFQGQWNDFNGLEQTRHLQSRGKTNYFFTMLVSRHRPGKESNKGVEPMSDSKPNTIDDSMNNFDTKNFEGG